jgi:ribonuclease BN (tRNA processing enzyme)
MMTIKGFASIVIFLAATPVLSAQPCRGDGMTLQVLGSGDPLVNPHRASTGYLVWLDGKSRILVDVGGGAFLRFGQAEGRLADLFAILISHLHPDHVSDLPALLWLSNFARKDPLPMVGPDTNGFVPSLSTFLSRLFDQKEGAFPMLGGTLRGSGFGVPLDVMLVGANPEPSQVIDRNGVAVSAMAVPHANVPSIAYRVRTARGTVVFGSDQSGEDRRFVEFARDADLLVMHLTSGVGQSIRGHASPMTVGELAGAAHPKQLVLSHIGQFDVKAAVTEVRKQYPGKIVVATDLRCVPVR